MLIFKKKKRKVPKRYALVAYSNEAQKLCTGGEENLKIYIYYKGRLVDIQDYSEERVRQLERMMIPVGFKDIKNVPSSCEKQPTIYNRFGILEFRGR